VSRSEERDVAFARFVEASSTSLLRAAFVLLNNREEAEDAVQTTLLRTLRRWERAEPAPAAYSRTVLVNICRERWRYRSRHPEAPGGLGESVRASVVVSLADAYESRHVLVSALRRLPLVQREVLVCRYLLDTSVTETALTLGIAEGTVKSATSRGLDQLRALLADEESEADHASHRP
jgi:RNA polymerase sigma-70 factor (sigma-E family)